MTINTKIEPEPASDPPTGSPPDLLSIPPLLTAAFNETRPVITVDYDAYAHFLDDTDLTDDQKREFLQALWTIITEFVSMGFAVHPVQQATENCGELPAIPLQSAATAGCVVDCESSASTDKTEEPREEYAQ